MAYISSTYATSKDAPIGHWVCTPSSGHGPMGELPSAVQALAPSYCGQCVSYVKAVCPNLPPTGLWRKGKAVKAADDILPGTVIATFNVSDRYEGHAAIYVSQNVHGINVYDQYVSPPSPKAIGPRLLRFGGRGRSNNGDEFHVVE